MRRGRRWFTLGRVIRIVSASNPEPVEAKERSHRVGDSPVKLLRHPDEKPHGRLPGPWGLVLGERMGRDSNSRDGCPSTRFPGEAEGYGESGEMSVFPMTARVICPDSRCQCRYLPDINGHTNGHTDLLLSGHHRGQHAFRHSAVLYERRRIYAFPVSALPTEPRVGGDVSFAQRSVPPARARGRVPIARTRTRRASGLAARRRHRGSR